ncbi:MULTISPECIES: UDP-N-acetylglucosamine 2-epimerase [Salinibaculum]|uniref:UDP-N-acetylglucosamine 2-epimerase n=1 Tax=Salinibaculum TaxID=2732368 RepID=UPI0030D0DEE8
MSVRRVTVVTGTRAEYGLLKSSMAAIKAHDTLELTTVATGMHLDPRHGCTVEDIEADGFDVSQRVHTEMAGDSGLTMAKELGAGISGLAESYGDLDPDIVLVLGDRDEAFAGGVAAAHMNIPVAHIHGGDAMEGAMIDDSIRHALTKFAHLHFPASERSRNRILELGEEDARVTLVGAPGLDAIRKREYTDPDAVLAEHGIDADPSLVLVVQHPVTTMAEEAGNQMAATLEAVTSIKSAPDIVVVYPNSDPGSRRMIDVIDRFEAESSILTFPNLPRHDFLGLMDAADTMVGNSSSGIIEAPSLDLPVVDIGPRQNSRQRSANTVEVPHEIDAIRSAVRDCLTNDALREQVAVCENPYDYGGAGSKIADRLATVELNPSLLRKRLTY